MVDFEMKQGDTLPFLEFVCKDTNGPVDISTATDVRLHITRNGVSILNESCVIDDDGSTPVLKGTGHYEWLAADTDDELGVYDFEIEVNYGGGKILTFPNGKTNPKIQINKQLA